LKIHILLQLIPLTSGEEKEDHTLSMEAVLQENQVISSMSLTEQKAFWKNSEQNPKIMIMQSSTSQMESFLVRLQRFWGSLKLRLLQDL